MVAIKDSEISQNENVVEKTTETVEEKCNESNININELDVSLEELRIAEKVYKMIQKKKEEHNIKQDEEKERQKNIIYEKKKEKLEIFMKQIEYYNPSVLRDSLRILVNDPDICKLIASNESYIKILDDNNITNAYIYQSEHTNPLWNNSYGFRWACKYNDTVYITKFLSNKETQPSSNNNYGIKEMIFNYTPITYAEMLFEHPNFDFNNEIIELINLAVRKSHPSLLKLLLKYISDDQLIHLKIDYFNQSISIITVLIEDNRIDLSEMINSYIYNFSYSTIPLLFKYKYINIVNKTGIELDEIKIIYRSQYTYDNDTKTLTIYKYDNFIEFNNIEEFLNPKV